MQPFPQNHRGAVVDDITGGRGRGSLLKQKKISNKSGDKGPPLSRDEKRILLSAIDQLGGIPVLCRTTLLSKFCRKDQNRFGTPNSPRRKQTEDVVDYWKKKLRAGTFSDTREQLGLPKPPNVVDFLPPVEEKASVLKDSTTETNNSTTIMAKKSPTSSPSKASAKTTTNQEENVSEDMMQPIEHTLSFFDSRKVMGGIVSMGTYHEPEGESEHKVLFFVSGLLDTLTCDEITGEIEEDGGAALFTLPADVHVHSEMALGMGHAMRDEGCSEEVLGLMQKWAGGSTAVQLPPVPHRVKFTDFVVDMKDGDEEEEETLKCKVYTYCKKGYDSSGQATEVLLHGLTFIGRIRQNSTGNPMPKPKPKPKKRSEIAEEQRLSLLPTFTSTDGQEIRDALRLSFGAGKAVRSDVAAAYKTYLDKVEPAEAEEMVANIHFFQEEGVAKLKIADCFQKTIKQAHYKSYLVVLMRQYTVNAKSRKTFELILARYITDFVLQGCHSHVANVLELVEFFVANQTEYLPENWHTQLFGTSFGASGAEFRSCLEHQIRENHSKEAIEKVLHCYEMWLRNQLFEFLLDKADLAEMRESESFLKGHAERLGLDTRFDWFHENLNSIRTLTNETPAFFKPKTGGLEMNEISFDEGEILDMDTDDDMIDELMLQETANALLEASRFGSEGMSEADAAAFRATFAFRGGATKEACKRFKIIDLKHS